MRDYFKNLLFVLLLFLVLSFLFGGSLKISTEKKEISLSEFKNLVLQEKVKEIKVAKDKILVSLKDGKEKFVRKEEGVSIFEILDRFGVPKEKIENIEVLPSEEKWVWLWQFLIFGLPTILLFVFFYYLLKQAKTGTGQIFEFTKIRPKRFGTKEGEKVTFKDIAGLKEAKEEIMEIVDFLKNPKKYQQMGAKIPRGVLLMGPPGTGKCVVGDTLIFTTKGIMEIKDVPRYFYVDKFSNKVEGAYLPTLDLENFENVVDKASNFYELEETETIKIITKQGFELEGTPEHPIVVLNEKGNLEFKELKDIQLGDLAAIKFNTQIFGNFEEITEEEAYLMGALTGDGNLSTSSRLEITTADKELAGVFVNYFKNNYPQNIVYERSQYPNRNKSKVYGIASWQAKKRFFEYGMSCFLSYDKYVPHTIMMGSKKIIVAFLQGLFDSDGYFESNRGAVGLSSVSKKLIDQVAMLLLNLGIVPSMRIKRPGDENHFRNVYELTISGSYLLKFAKEIGFRLPRKQKVLEKYLMTRWQGNTNVDVIYNVGELVEKVWREISIKRKSNSWLANVVDKTRDKNRISRNALAKFIEELEKRGVQSEEFYYLKKLLEADLYFVPIVKKEYRKNKVYDFTVEKSHSFISNGFISHNTLLARATATEAGVPFFSISASEVIELFVGVGASVTGDTPVLIKIGSSTKLLPIGEFVDQFYPPGKEGYVIPVFGVKTLGYQPLETKCWGASKNAATKFFGKSCWTEVKGVYRHKVNEIYEIHYLGGVIKTTGDHSIFVRHRNFIKPKKVSELKVGDILVNLPFKTRGEFIPGIGTTHKIKAHEFPLEIIQKELPVWNEDSQLEKSQIAYEYALTHRGILSQRKIGEKFGLSQTTIGFWQRGIHRPQYFYVASRYKKKGIPQKVKITPALLKLLGYYTAEGRREDYYLQFVFGKHEKELHRDCINLMKEIFGIEPHLRYTENNSLRIIYHSKFLGDFFEKHCGNGSHHKHIPEFLWDLPKEYFLSYLDGLSKGDGYTSKEGKLIISSTSKQLILELTWLSAMHGIKVGVGKRKSKGGRIIKNKPLPEGEYWVLTIGRTTHPFQRIKNSPFQFKKPVVKKIVKKPYQGYVYDLCGCENEAFFGGEKPILLHNSRIRNLFEQARKAGKAIIFIDEIDSIGKIRGVGVTGGHEEREQTLNQLLAEMDGIGREENLIVMGATNRPETLDPALLRPGRFDRKIVLDLPDVKDREEILKIHCRGKALAQNVDLKEIAQRTPGFSGADLANLVNEAALLAARKNKTRIEQTELLEAIDKVLLGPERKSHLLSQKEKEITAFHEVGHALVSSFVKGGEPVRKISIIPRGLAAGYTLKASEEERKIKTKTEILAEICVLLGGYLAEKLVFKETSTGAQNDLREATFLARKFVKDFGMSALGPISFGEKKELAFLGWEGPEIKNYSEATAQKIDQEIKKVMKQCEEKALRILKQKRKLLEKIAKILIQKETLEREEFEKLIGKR